MIVGAGVRPTRTRESRPRWTWIATHHGRLGVEHVCARNPLYTVHAPSPVTAHSGKPAGVGHAHSRRNNHPTRRGTPVRPTTSPTTAPPLLIIRRYTTYSSHHGSTWRSRGQLSRDARRFSLTKDTANRAPDHALIADHDSTRILYVRRDALVARFPVICSAPGSLFSERKRDSVRSYVRPVSNEERSFGVLFLALLPGG